MKLLHALSSAGRMELLRVLSEARRPMTFSEVSLRAHQHHSTSLVALKTLVRDGLVKQVSKTRPATYEIANDNPLAASLLAATDRLVEIEQDYCRPLFLHNFVKGLSAGMESSPPDRTQTRMQGSLLRIARQLNRAEVQWALSGTSAANAYTGLARTFDFVDLVVSDSRDARAVTKTYRQPSDPGDYRVGESGLLRFHFVRSSLGAILQRAQANVLIFERKSVPVLTPEDFFVERLLFLSLHWGDYATQIRDLTDVFHRCSVMNVQVILNRLEDLRSTPPERVLRAFADDVRRALGHKHKCGRKRGGRNRAARTDKE